MMNNYGRKKNNLSVLILLLLIVLVALWFVWRMPSRSGDNAPVAEEPPVSEINEVKTEESVFDEVPEGFDDGLRRPVSIQQFAPDAFGAGLVERAEYTPDINQDGRPDRIIRNRVESGTAHFAYVYEIYLNVDGQMLNITPSDFRTIEGADCALQKLQFSFRPDFSVTKITRPLGDEWNTPTASTKTVYGLWNDRIHPTSSIVYKTACDVSELF